MPSTLQRCAVLLACTGMLACARPSSAAESKIQAIGDVQLVPPPFPWHLLKEYSRGDARIYRWDAGNNISADLMIRAMPSKEGNSPDKLMAAEKEKAAHDPSTVAPPDSATADDRGPTRLHAIQKKNDKEFSDDLVLWQPVGDDILMVGIEVHSFNGQPPAAVVQLADKLGIDVAKAAKPKGQAIDPAAATVPFDVRPLYANRKLNPGVWPGDRPAIHASNAFDGRPLNLTDYKGKLVIVDFWATWCGPCMAEAPHMVKLSQENASRGVQIIGVSLDEDRQKMIQTAKSSALTWPQVFAGGAWTAPLAREWGINSIPCTFIIGPDGDVLWRGHPAEIDGVLAAAVEAFPPGSSNTATEEKAVTASASAKPATVAPARHTAITPKPAASTPASPTAPKPAAEPEPLFIPPDPAEALAAARKARAAHPSDAYRIYKSLVKSSPLSPQGKSAATEMSAMEQDPAVVKKAMSAPYETKAASALNMANNYLGIGQTAKAKQRYEQVIKDYPDTMCAAVAKRKLDDTK